MHARRTAPVATIALLAALAAALLGDRATGATAATARLAAFSSCGELAAYTKKNALPLVGPYGLGGAILPAVPSAGGVERQATPAPAPTAGVDFSATNVQEQGVDEPDLVKTDGTTVFTVAGGKVRAVDVSGKSPRLLDALALPDGWSAELLLVGHRLLVVSRGSVAVPLPRPATGARLAIMPIGKEQTRLTQVDVSNPAALRIVATLTVDGGYLSAREAGGTIRLVVRAAMTPVLPYVQPVAGDAAATAAATAQNRKLIQGSRALDWLPRATVVNRTTGARRSHALVQCRSVLRPAAFSGLGTLTVLTIDLAKGLDPVDSDAILSDADTVYASTSSLYVATQRWAGRPDPASTTTIPEGLTTAVHRFAFADDDRTVYRATGQVSGTLLSQWSLSENAGVLRVASTDTPSWWSGDPRRESESFVTTLREQDGRLTQVGRVGGLGKGERIYAVRFIGDVGYVVTFRQVDPLYTLDLSDAERPRVVGELKIQGYSSYLHPIGDDLLLGLGQDASSEGRVLGSQLSLFDVADPRRPDRLHQKVIGPGSSEAEYDHHAFLYWAARRLVVIPVQTYAATPTDTWFGGVVAFRVSRTGGIEELGRIAHPAVAASQPGSSPGAEPVLSHTPIRRSLVVGDAVVTVSEAGLRANALEGLADRGWVAFT